MRPQIPEGLTPQRRAQEEWIRRYDGFFGEPLKLREFRAGTITFKELYNHSKGHAEDMVSDATRCDYEAFQ